MGNKLSCSCAPLIKKAYRYEDTPFSQSGGGTAGGRRRDGHLLRLWAEVFHVSAASGAVRWQQVSEDLVPVNITCIQDTPECIFHITAYNSQVEKILDVRLQQPGTRLGQASECFVYWKDVATGDTWGLNFTSPLDAKQFRELCSPSFKFARKASSSYSLTRLNEPSNKKHQQANEKGGGAAGQGQGQATAAKRKPQSTPSSPSRHRDRERGQPNQAGYNSDELQCTCMTADTLHRQRNGRVRYTASATLPRSALRQDSAGTQSAYISAYPSTTSVNAVGQQQQQQQQRAAGRTAQQAARTQAGQTAAANASAANLRNAQYSRAQYAQSVRKSTDAQTRSMDAPVYHHTQQHPAGQQGQHQTQQAAYQRAAAAQAGRDRAVQIASQQSAQAAHAAQQAAAAEARNRSKSSDDVRRTVATGTEDLGVDSRSLKRMLHPLCGPLDLRHQVSLDTATQAKSCGTNTTTISSLSQPGSRRESRGSGVHIGGTNGLTRPTSVPSWSYFNSSHGENKQHASSRSVVMGSSGVQLARPSALSSGQRSRSECGQGRGRSLERGHCVDFSDLSPTTITDDPRLPFLPDNVNRCYATTPTPSSSGDEREGGHHGHGLGHGGGGKDRPSRDSRPGHKEGRSASPTIKILQEYETHLRNALAKGADADTYSLNTFETILSQSMENVVALMKEVQSEIEAIRREEQHFRSAADEAIYTPRGGRPHWARSYTLPSRGTSLPPGGLMGSSTSDLYAAMRKCSAPILDTLSIDGGLPFGGPGHTLRPQSSFESTDSRAYLTSSEMSDDERLSLTTAISDDDDGDAKDSPYRAKSGAAAAAFQCTGAVRKAGFLSVKKWLLRKRHQIELARKRGWKGYWVCLKGTTLLFYPCDSRDGRAIESTPRHLIIVDGAIMQPIPEHPKRDHIFCLSTAFGDAYLFQAPCQIELDNWIGAIHNACGAAFARHRGKTGALHLLQDDIQLHAKHVETDAKLKHMAELQRTVVADGESRKSLYEQIRGHEESLEQYHCEQYRLRCYMASLQATELPNPKTLLGHVSKPTKLTLNRLGVFTVSSFHAYICARSPSMLTNVISGRGASRRRSAAASTTARPLSRANSMGSRQGSVNRGSGDTCLPGDRVLQLLLPPDGNPQAIYVRGKETVEELLWAALGDKQLQPNDYFIRLIRGGPNVEAYVPTRHEILETFPVHEAIEVLAKVLFQVELTRLALDQLFGFSVEAELVENAADLHNQDELCVYVSRVEDHSLASQQGLTKGDEIMVINGSIVSDLDMMYIESVLQEEQSLCMMIRSCRTEAPELAAAVRSTDEYIESLVCPPPPSDGVISDEMLGKLIVPSPWMQVDRTGRGGYGSGGGHQQPCPSVGTSVSGEQIAESLLKSAEQVTSEYCRLSACPSNPQPGHPSMSQQHGGGGGGHYGQIATTNTTAAQPTGQHMLHTTQLQIHPVPQSALLGGPGASVLTSSVVTHLPQPQPQLLHQQSVEEEGMYIKRPPLSDAEKLRKVIKELVDTEKTYVEHLNSLLDIYLEPMKAQNFLSTADTQALFGNITEIVAFQRQFLASLNEAIANEGRAFDKFDQPGQFKAALFSLGNTFLSYVDKFKLYSSFCASHSKAQKILHPSSEVATLNPALSEFLNVRSRGQHAFSLESYLIKPIQRILKYPLLLQQLKHLTDPASEEHRHLSGALKGMERVAEHINEMQRIHEEYGAIFDHLQRQYIKQTKAMIELSPVELLYYGGVDWVNISEFLGKIKKGLDLHAMCFVFKQAVVFLCKERIRQKKKLVGVSSKLSEVEIIRYQVLIPVTEVQVRATTTPGSGRDSGASTGSGGGSGGHNGTGSNNGSTDGLEASTVPPAQATPAGSQHFIWELIHLRCTQISGGTQRRTEKVYQLSNSTNEFRNAFLRTIRQIIRESVRNMAVPFTKAAILGAKPNFQTTIASSPLNTQTTTVTSSTSAVQPTATVRQVQPQTLSSSQSSAAQATASSSSHGPPTSSSNSAQKSADKDKAGAGAPQGQATSKTKPPPPPRAATTVKSTPGPSTATGQVVCSASCTGTGVPPVPPHGTHAHTHGKNNVCCGLCGADVGLGQSEAKSSPADNSDTSGSNSGARPKVYAKSTPQAIQPTKEESFESDETGLWMPR